MAEDAQEHLGGLAGALLAGFAADDAFVVADAELEQAFAEVLAVRSGAHVLAHLGEVGLDRGDGRGALAAVERLQPLAPRLTSVVVSKNSTVQVMGCRSVVRVASAIGRPLALLGPTSLPPACGRSPYDVKQDAPALNTYLRLGGSVWAATPTDELGEWQLTRRSLGPVRESIEELLPSSDRAHRHLMRAWSKLAGRNPDPSTPYMEAVRAVECVDKPTVAPNDPKASLGKMIGAIRDAPHKWTFVLGNDPKVVADMAGLVWRSQLDRHGTDDEGVPPYVSPEAAGAAVHICITLVRIVAGGLFKQT